jgi:hypothetical protein
MSLLPEHPQEISSPTSHLTLPDNAHLGPGEHEEGLTLEQEPFKSLLPNNPPAEELTWHTPELSLPKAEIPANITLSDLDMSFSEAQTPLPDPIAPAAAVGLPLPSGTSESATEALKKPPAIPPGGLQTELPLTDPALDLPSGSTIPSPTSLPRPVAEAGSAPIPAQPVAAAASATWAGNAHEDNIPLLQDVIDAVETLAPRAAPTGLSTEQARRMAIQVAARLNVELRRSGKRALGTDVITRLARMLQETLAQSPPNVDNKPHNKD